MDELLIFFTEMIGTIAFAISGSLIAISCEFDIFGTIAIGVITSTFGGVFRDIVLGSFPPSAFKNPTYVLTAFIVSVAVFAIMYIRKQNDIDSSGSKILFWMDALGLGIFSVMGVISAYQAYGTDNAYLCIFCGMITGVGGGMLRDICVNRLPAIFVRHIYAIAAILGSCIMYGFLLIGRMNIGMWAGVASVMMLRYLAVHFNWNLPRIRRNSEK